MAKAVTLYMTLTITLLELSKTMYISMFYLISQVIATVLSYIYALRLFPLFSVIQPIFLFSQLVRMAVVQQKLNSLLNLLATLLGEEI